MAEHAIQRKNASQATARAAARRISTPLPNRVLFADSVCRLVVVMVGLPARGKTYTAQKLARYLRWLGIKTAVFNVGSYRRDATGHYDGHELFRADNEDGKKQRLQFAMMALQDVANWFEEEQQGGIAIFDATNSTRDRRDIIINFCSARRFDVLFVESICDDAKMVEDNIRELKIRSPDYVGMDINQAIADFQKRIEHYNAQYQPLDLKFDTDLPFIQVFNGGRYYVVNQAHGAIHSKIAYYLMNLRLKKRTIYICRHGESEDNLKGRIGGDSPLTERGREFARQLGKFVNSERDSGELSVALRVWTSHLKRTIETASYITGAVREPWKALNEIDAGVCEGMTYEEIQEKFPQDFAKRDNDKFHYRYPSGESYLDLVARLEPVIIELERQSSALLVCHQAVARCLIAYFLDKSSDELPYIEVPLHTVLKLTLAAYGCHFEHIPLQVEAVNTQRLKPTNVALARSDEEALSTVPPHF